MQFNWKVILNVMGILVAINGLFMLLCIPTALYYQEGGLNVLAIPAGITSLLGGGTWFFTRKNQRILNKRDGYIIVTMGWLCMSLAGCLPYFLLGDPHFPDFASAFFESISGFTTTGASILNDIEAVPKSVLLWRSLTHWIGGMGIIVLTIAILPLLGIGGMQLFAAESPGPTPDKLHPRITETAKRLWLIYVGMTVVETLLLWIGGMTFFDAINHAFATVSTGGFSTKGASLAHFDDPFIQYVVIFFMFLSGINFSLTYFALKRDFSKVWRNEEFKTFLIGVVVLTIITALIVYQVTPNGAERSFRDALFQVVAVITTTGFVTADFTAWAPFLTVMFFLLMFVGASAGSTSGGVKIVRHIIIFRNGFSEFKRLLHPRAIIPVRFNKKTVESGIVLNVLAFFMIYMGLFAIGCLAMGAFGNDYVTVLGSVATSLGNVGPGLGDVNPVSNFAHFGIGEKFLLSFFMLLGRLELFTVLILFTPYFWRTT